MSEGGRNPPAGWVLTQRVSISFPTFHAKAQACTPMLAHRSNNRSSRARTNEWVRPVLGLLMGVHSATDVWPQQPPHTPQTVPVRIGSSRGFARALNAGGHRVPREPREALGVSFGRIPPSAETTRATGSPLVVAYPVSRATCRSRSGFWSADDTHTSGRTLRPDQVPAGVLTTRRYQHLAHMCPLPGP